ncbi:hypothetical protein L202_05535 [Cryptococcus amylolentus CBS 6039]|uniref:Exocyst complex component Sec8 n=2 Tax=Cryptococcus amylolentus TaxID=104669 RepID=A0A1E3HKV0_9TREE|nr:hypothetical protein L202_05535 [Cryptococcus amylolentus CBS 6039]ODN76972.1 hypothetical protein L202_05535 [Cryptococcus amylolentus CBS 6039]ODO04853.1 hypothetical protein I350_05463 [Cryptococcus amylolentus CBS 6273]
MSRAPSTRYKISNPQPLPSDLRSAYNTDAGPYPSFPTPLPRQSSQRDGPSSNASTTPSKEHGGAIIKEPSTSPARPARSRMRDVPQPDVPQRRNADTRTGPGLPIQTSQISARTSAQSDGLDIPPLSPMTPSAQGHDQELSETTDVFANDRSQRSELRAQVSAAVQQSQQPFRAHKGTGSDQVRNAVGAFLSAGRSREDTAPPARRPKHHERSKREVKEEQWEDDFRNGQASDIDLTLRQVRKDWPFVMESDFSASTLALSLLSDHPSSSLPEHPGISPFLRLHDSLSTALQSAVQSESKPFAASLPAHQNFLDILAKAQEQVRESKSDLKAARDGFAGKGKTELAIVRTREKTVRDMLKILDTIDHIKQVPDQLETLIGDKQFLRASLMLVRSLKTVNKPELLEIGALSDLRSYLTSQETTLSEILIEELHNHLYLKTFYSDSRWLPYQLGQRELPIIDPQEDESALSRSPDPSVTKSQKNDQPTSRFSRYLAQLDQKPSADPMLLYNDDLAPPTSRTIDTSHGLKASTAHDFTTSGSQGSLSSLAGDTEGPPEMLSAIGLSNPEAESFSYIESLLEALAAMGRLGQALDVVTQRAPAETHGLVESTLDEVDDRSQRRDALDVALRTQSSANPDIFAMPMSSSSQRTRASLEVSKFDVSFEATGPPQHVALLNDLFWTLYSKLCAVLEGHRVLYEVSRWIASRRDFRNLTTQTGSNMSSNAPVSEMWRPIQQEVKSLLSSYLTDDQQGSTLNRHHISSVNELMRDPRVSRDRGRQMFKFTESDARAVQSEIKSVDDSVQEALHASVPGLVNPNSEQPVLFTVDNDDRSVSGRYRTLVPPNAFNVTTLFQPTLSFIQRTSQIVPQGFEDEMGGIDTVLEDFVVKVFLPQLDEKVTAGFQQAVSGYDAYQVDRALLVDMPQPPTKSSARVMTLIHTLCVMLQTTPFHRENYSRLIIGVIVQYYQQCSTHFKDLASVPSTMDNPSDRPLTVPAIWAQREDVTMYLSELRSAMASPTPAALSSIYRKELSIELDLLGSKAPTESQLINSQRKLEALGDLLRSLRWFVNALVDLESVADETTLPEGDSLNVNPIANTRPSINDEEPRLPLTRAMAERYRAIIQTYEQLAEMILNTIRLEIRCRVMCNLGAFLQNSDFRLESEALEPDSDILDLNTNLVEAEELVRNAVSCDDHEFVFQALGPLVDHCFTGFASRRIKCVNGAGVRKIKRNITSLQQILRGIGTNSDNDTLSKALGYWGLYEQGPKKMLEGLKAHKGRPPFAFEEYNTMLKLQCTDDTDELNTHLIDLHALSMEIDGWDLGED